MTTSHQSLDKISEDLKSKIQKRRENSSEISLHLHKVSNLKRKFSKYTEEATPKPALSNKYTCVGRLKFYPDGMLYMYLEVSKNCQYNETPWPARVDWKVELVDENDPRRAFPLGESSFIFNKPKQGFISHPNDWIAISFEQLENSQMIGLDGSMTLRWSVMAEPALELIYLEQLEELLLQRNLQHELNIDQLDLNKVLGKVVQISDLCKENTVEISELQECVERITGSWENLVLELKSIITKHNYQISTLEKDVRNLNSVVHNS